MVRVWHGEGVVRQGACEVRCEVISEHTSYLVASRKNLTRSS